MIEEIDDHLMSRVQRFSNWIHSLTGCDSIEQARFLAGMGAIAWIWAIVSWQQVHRSFDWVASLLLLRNVYSCFFETRYEARIRAECQQGFRNRRRADPFYRATRLLGLLIAVTWLGQESYRILLALTVGEGLLLSCDVQTPRIGRIKEALSRLSLLPAPRRA